MIFGLLSTNFYHFTWRLKKKNFDQRNFINIFSETVYTYYYQLNDYKLAHLAAFKKLCLFFPCLIEQVWHSEILVPLNQIYWYYGFLFYFSFCITALNHIYYTGNICYSSFRKILLLKMESLIC